MTPEEEEIKKFFSSKLRSVGIALRTHTKDRSETLPMFTGRTLFCYTPPPTGRAGLDIWQIAWIRNIVHEISHWAITPLERKTSPDWGFLSSVKDKGYDSEVTEARMDFEEQQAAILDIVTMWALFGPKAAEFEKLGQEWRSVRCLITSKTGGGYVKEIKRLLGVRKLAHEYPITNDRHYGLFSSLASSWRNHYE
tara:strand:- start:1076 stop:1660 length:585 start_codon:yes stop_codon:yes gene_type:complete